MPETTQPESENNKEPQNQSDALEVKPSLQVGPVGLPKGLCGILVCGGISLLALLVASVLHPHLSERFKFFTVNSLSLLVLHRDPGNVKAARIHLPDDRIILL